MAIAAQDDMQASIPEPSVRLGCGAQHIAQRSIICSPVPIPHGRPIGADHGTRPPLAHLVTLFEMGDGLAPGGGRYHFFESRSFSAVLSSIASASSRFSLPLFARSLGPVAFTGSLFEGLQALCLRRLHAAELRLPSIERGATDPVPAADLCSRRTRLLLSQDRDDLLFGELRSLHVRSSHWDGL
ncbi:hypothetical protein SDC9_38957 [bioreactor metagenome]|uniref:Uncharacterized protein n=1 Tax=bioreactor metagenome TaxID=1076179 RepID=A0A644VND9_9ZZZZ